MSTRSRFKRMPEEKLWVLYKDSKHKDSRGAQEEIARRYYNLVEKAAGKKYAGTPKSVSLDELQSDAQLGLHDAMKRYDPSVGAPFGSWAYLKMTGHMQDGLRRLASLKSAPITNADVPIEHLESEEDWDADTSIKARMNTATREIQKAVINLSERELDLMLEILGNKKALDGKIHRAKIEGPECVHAFDKILWSIVMKKDTIANLNKNEKGKARPFEIQQISDLDLKDPEFFPTGVLQIDEKLGGGFAKGRIVELYGMEGSGKTSLSLTAAGVAQKAGVNCLLYDLESTFDRKFSTKLGVDVDKLFYTTGGIAEDALESVIAAAETGEFGIIIVDSVAALMSRAEFEGEIGQANIGAVARILGQAMRKLAKIAAESGTTVIFINQLRDNVGGFTGPSKITPGGKALRFFASQRIEVVGNIGQIKKGDVTVGKKTLMKVIKNKLASPMQQCEVEFYFESGYSNGDYLLDIAIKEGRIAQKGAWFYDGETGEKIGQGRAKAFDWLEEQEGVAGEGSAPA